MRFTFTQKSARKMARTLEKYLKNQGIEVARGKAMEALARMQGERDSNALLASVSQQAIDARLSDVELTHMRDSADCQYGEECEMRVHTGFALRYSAVTEECEYVRVVDPLGRELMYWHCDEWKEDPALVMGAILGALVRGNPILPSDRSAKSIPREEIETSRGRVSPLSEKFKVYVQARALTEHADGPRWAQFTLDQGLLEKLLKVAEAANEHNMVTARIWGEPDAWSFEDRDSGFGPQVDEGVIEVSNWDFWFRACMKHADYYIETTRVALAGLLGATSGPAEAREPDYTRSGQVIVYCEFADDRDALLTSLIEDGEIPASFG